MARRPDKGSKDIFIIAAITMVIVGALIFYLLRILGHAEKHVDTVKKTKIKYSESLTWRSDKAASEDKVKSDYMNYRTQTKADYGDLNLTKNSFILMGKMTHLKELRMTRATFKESWLKYLTNLPLRHLGLHATPISDKSIPVILSIKGLESLEIGDTEVTDQGLAELSASRSITHLEINLGRRITNDGIKNLANMPQLRILEFAGSKNVTAACLADLTPLRNLENLGINYLQVEPKDLDVLEEFKRLSLIDASDCSLNDSCVARIARVPSLTVINLNGSNLTDKGLEKLTSLKNLQLLSLKDCPNLTDRGIQELQQKLPRCHVVYPKRTGLAKKLQREDVQMELLLLKDEAKNELEKMK